MLPSALLSEIAKACAEVEGIEQTLTYEPTAELVVRPTAWVGLETLGRSELTISDYWRAEGTFKIVVAIPRTKTTKTQTWDLAMAVGSHLSGQRWGPLLTEPAELIRIDYVNLPDFGDDVDSCEIEIMQPVCFPKLDPAFAGHWLTNPSAAWISSPPEVGIPHIPDYEKISEFP